MREQILNEIRRIAGQNGQTPGVRLFENETGIRQGVWRGIYWARWNDAVKEAGLEPNAKQERHDEEHFLRKFAEACRHFGKFPTSMELRMYSQSDAEFPADKSVRRQFGSLANVPSRLSEWAKVDGGYPEVIELLGARVDQPKTLSSLPRDEGLVYLIRSGAHYKIGRSDELERRVKEIRIALPEKAVLVHSIRTDDPPGIEAYWHRRFADRRANGEWFKLTAPDIAAFKRRKFQ